MNTQENLTQFNLEKVMNAAPDRETKNVLHQIYNQAATAKVPLSKLAKPFADVAAKGYSKESLGDCTAEVFGQNVPPALRQHIGAKATAAAPKEDAEDDDDDDDDEKKPRKAKPHKK